MDQMCEQFMLESIEEMNQIDDEIYSESMFYLVDEYIDDYVNESMTNIFNSNSDNTVYSALMDLMNSPIKSDETDCENDSDFSYIDWAPIECYDDQCTEEDLRNEFYDKPMVVSDDDDLYNDHYDSLFGDNQ